MQLGKYWEKEQIGDKSYRHIQFQRPIAYNDGGVWKYIVNNFIDSGIPQRPHTVDTASFAVSVGDDGFRRIHPTKEVDVYLEVGTPFVKVGGVWQEVGFTGANRTGNKITWSRIQADMSVTMFGHGIKLDILLKNGYVPEDSLVAFPFNLNGLTRSGDRLLANGVPVMVLRRPVVVDNDNLDDIRPITHSFVNLSGPPYVLLELPDLAGMASPLVDPTLVLQPNPADGKDTRLYDGSPNTNYATFTRILLGDTDGDASTANKGEIAFDFSGIPAGSTIDTATLSLYEKNAGDTAGLGSWAVNVHRLLRDWVETEATWNVWSTGNSWTSGGAESDGNDRAAAISATVTLDGTAAIAFVDISSATLATDVQNFIDGVNPNYGWTIEAPTAENLGNLPAAFNDFWSSDYVTDPSLRPKFTVDYTEAVAGDSGLSALSGLSGLSGIM